MMISQKLPLKITPLKFNIAPEKWWLENYFPIGKVTFQGRTVKLPGCNAWKLKITCENSWLPAVRLHQPTVASAVRFLNSRLKALPNDIVVDIQCHETGFLYH